MRARPAEGSAAYAADAVRAGIADGAHRPGDHLSEDELSRGIGVSRNTLREAFRILAREDLLEHRPNRGVFVRVVDGHDIDDIFATRVALETAALRAYAERPRADGLARVDAVLERAADAAARGDGETVGREDIAFHRELVALAGSPRLLAAMDRLLGELGLVFVSVADPAAFHGDYLQRNRDLRRLLGAARWAEAEAALRDYLEDARRDTARRYREALADRA